MKKFLVILLFVPALLQATEILELDKNTDDMNVEILKIVNGITKNGMKAKEETRGFDYRYESKAISSFNLNIYIGRLDEKKGKTLFRIESPLNGLEKSLKMIVEKEIADPQKPVNFNDYAKKHHLFSAALDIIFPAASVYYNGKNSPLYTASDRGRKMKSYILYEILLVGGTYWYAQSKMKDSTLQEKLIFKPTNRDPLKSEFKGMIIGAFVATRLYRLAGAINETTSHNRLLQFAYTKKY